MQILNISVMNRPQKNITSRPYPTDVLESIHFDCDVGVQQSNYALAETSNYTCGITYGTIRELLVSYTLEPERSEYQCGMYNVQVTYEVVYKNTTMDTETSQYVQGLLDVQVVREVRYITQNIDTESSQYVQGIFNVQITN